MIIRAPHNPLSSFFLLRFTAKPQNPHFPPHTTLFSRLCSSSSSPSLVAETSSETSTTVPPSHHPWPEWVSFVDRLKLQGYFPQKSSDDGFRYGEVSLLKDPCLSFARDRYDLFRSLSKGDIQTLVERGCPKIQRKVINSAKRLRVYVGLEEKSVCNICSLQGSCDRAFVMLGESEGGARMVDVMRLLLTYALDPVTISGAVSTTSIEQAESASRRLLSLLVNLSEASTGLPPREFSENSAHKKEQSVNSRDAALSQDVEKKKGDWTCPKCNFMNFSKNIKCRKCNEEGPKRVSAVVEMKKGDWKCLQCECINFASRRNCFRCKDPRPPRALEPGEWECFKCDFLNFRRNVICLKCGSEPHKEAVPHDKIQNKRTNLVVE
ncbi:zinc finger protein VAR3, chloroplastic-like [Chenopodium quinoa]|uniref:zinc finger protein VAR3, chloroplastic-like n=1 Tax=Chenopodium quinoa TaxID=63459 RepID=UPI000B792DF0|nr:zinc finger protein VAR3, chloroplastic-like [Chenopodium quinoa]